jgi:RimJ/RimL family protein N-acetyltransferase
MLAMTTPADGAVGRIVIETERLVLRELVAGDEDALASMFADEDVMRFIGTGGARDRNAARETIERERAAYASRGWGEWATVERSSGDVIGLCGLILWPDVDGEEELEVAYLLDKAAWGKGYATEAATAIRDWAIVELGRTRLVSFVYHDNIESMKVARKLGMTWEKDARYHGAHLAMYSLLAGDD